jgi:hypothetical protein
VITFGDGAGEYGFASADGGAGNDVITFGDSAGHFYGSAIADGGNGNDTITFGDDAGENGFASADGGMGADTFIFGDRVYNLWIDLGYGDIDSVTFEGAVYSATIQSWEHGVDANIVVVDPSEWATQVEDGNTVLTTADGQSLTFLDITDTDLKVTDFLMFETSDTVSFV